MLAHFGVGAARSIFTGRGVIRSGMDMFIVGLGVAAVGYFVGELPREITVGLQGCFVASCGRSSQ
jgi:VIT1/CCC1 family predicted Fe2+/Mn2+ transporter